MSVYKTSGATSIYLQKILSDNSSAYGNVLDKLSSGKKFVTVGDDPIGVTRTAQLGVKINVNNIVQDNVSLGKDLLATAEGAQGTVLKNLQRVKDLTLQISNQVYTSENKDAVISEIRARLQGIDYVSDNTDFAGIKLLDGSASNLTLQIGVDSSASLNVGKGLIDTHTTQLGGDISLDPAISGSNWTQAQIDAYMDKLDIAIGQIVDSQANLGGFSNRLDYSLKSLTNIENNLTELKSVISDVDIAEETSNLVKYQVLQQASASILTQANQANEWALSLLQK